MSSPLRILLSVVALVTVSTVLAISDNDDEEFMPEDVFRPLGAAKFFRRCLSDLVLD